MDYFNEKWAYYDMKRSAVDPLPSWLPRQGLAYYDDFGELREYAPTGQHYIIESRNSSTATFSIQTFAGKKCLYKDKAGKQIRFNQASDTGTFTAGIWVYDNLQTSTNQQSFNIQSPNVMSVMINNRSSSRYFLGLYDYTTSSTKYGIYGGTEEKQKWNLLVARQLATGWEFWLNNVYKGNAAHLPQTFSRVLIHYYQNYGTGLRDAFLYDRVLTEAEMTTIYDNTK